MFILFFRRLPRSILFPYTTLFRSLGIAYWIAGVPSPALLGAVTGFMALIPGGAPLSFTLVSIDRKSTRLNSSHVAISYDVFCLKEKIISYTRSRERYPDLE